MIDFPKGVEIGTAPMPLCCEQCGESSDEPRGDFDTPPAGWMVIKANFFDGHWPGIQPLSMSGDNNVLFCCPACASAWIVRWGDACVGGFAPAPEACPSPDDPPRYLGLRREGH
uniref:Uncharacterized protein n=1 Tax=viral metagenome TaxID=1070528 RepID=A0A6H2A3B7_9ZZZZ